MSKIPETPPTPLSVDQSFEQVFGNQEIKNNQEQREQVEKQRELIKQALEKSIQTLKKFLEDNKTALSEVERAKIAWAVNSAEQAKVQSLDKGQDEYMVAVMNPDGTLAKDEKTGEEIQRPEGVPIDGLKEALSLVAEVQSVSKDSKDSANKKINQANDVLEYLKHQDGLGVMKKENLEKFLDNSAPELKADLEQLVGQWLEADKKSDGVNHDKLTDQDNYEFKFYLSQLAEATRQLQGKYQEQVATPDLKIGIEADELNQLKETLQTASKDYFERHYDKKHGIGLTKEESDQQHLFTEREAAFIDEDKDLRQLLESKYQDQIQKYSELDRSEQNYQLAMLALRDREVLELPKVQEEEAVAATEVAAEVDLTPLEVPPALEKILLVNIDEIAKSMAWRKAEQKLHEYFRNSRFIKKVWKSFSEDYYRVKYYKEALKEITENNSLLEAIRGRLEGQGVDRHNPELKDYFELLDSIIEQYENSLMKGSESGDQIAQTDEVAQLIARMVSAHASGDIRQWAALGPEYANPAMDPRARIELFVRNEISPKITGANWGDAPSAKTGRLSKFMNRGKDEPTDKSLYANNMWKVAEHYRIGQEQQKAEYLRGVAGDLNPEQKAELESKLAEHMAGLRNLDIQLGTKERDLYNNKPKGVLRFYEKIMDATEGKWYGKVLANPLTIGIGTALASRGTMSAMRYGGIAAGGVLGVALSPYVLPILAGGATGFLYRAFRTNKDLKYDISRERRNETLGGDKSDLLDQRGGLRYQTASYDDAFQILDRIAGREYAQLSPQEQQELALLVAMRNLEKSDNNQVDLFVENAERGSKSGSVIASRNKLDLALRQWEGQVDTALVSDLENSMTTDIAQQDRSEKIFRAKRSTISGVVGGTVGMGGGLLAQEGLYMGLRHLGVMDSGRSTALEYMADKATGDANHDWNWLVGRANNLVAEGDPYAFVGPDGQKMTYADLANLKGSENVVIQDVNGNYFDESGRQLSQGEVDKLASGKLMTLQELPRKDWHGVGRNFHGKELQQWHVWDKGRKNVSIDVYNMMKNVDKNIEGNHTINWDKTRDPKMTELLAEMRSNKASGQLYDRIQVRVFPTDEMYDSNKGLDLGAIDKSGSLKLTDQMREAMFDKNGKQIARAIEVGYLDNNGQYHTLNTAVGKGSMEIPSNSSSLVKELKPANYDFAIPLVPPSRKVWGRQGDKERAKEQKPGKRNGQYEKSSGIQKRGDKAKISLVAQRRNIAEGRVGMVNSRDFYQELNNHFAKTESLAKSERLTKLIDRLSEQEKEKLSNNLGYILVDKDSEVQLANPDFVANLIEFTLSLDQRIIDQGYTVVFTNKRKGLQITGKDIEVNSRADLRDWQFGIAAALRVQQVREQRGGATSNIETQKEEKVELGTATMKSIPKIEASIFQKNLDKVELRGDKFQGRQLEAKDLVAQKLVPEYKVQLEGKQFLFSKPYDLGQGRLGIVLYADNGKGGYSARSYYRSNSTGLWRYLPSYLSMGEGKINWYHKGYGQESLTAPAEIQAKLAEISGESKNILKVDNPELIFAGLAKSLDKYEEGTYVREVESSQRPLDGEFYSGTGDDKVEPEKINFKDKNFEPDFDKKIMDWKQKTDLYGTIKVSLYPSENDELRYMFCEDKQGRVWIGGIETKSPITSLGVRKQWFSGGDLSTPAFEYKDEAGSYGNTEMRGGENNEYVDMSEKYLKKIKIIKDYMAHNKKGKQNKKEQKPKIEDSDSKIKDNNQKQREKKKTQTRQQGRK